MRVQIVGGADAGEHQQLRAADRARGEDDLGFGPGCLLLPAVQVGDTGGPAAFDDEPGGEGVGLDRQVVRLPCQVGVGGTAAPPVALGHLIETDPVLARPVEVVVLHRAATAGGGDEAPGMFGLVAEVLNGQWSPLAVIRAGVTGVVLGAEEVGQQVAVPPAGAAELVAPAVVVQAVAADVDHRVQRGAPAEDPAARPVHRAVACPLLRERDVVPVVPAPEQPDVRGGDLDLLDVLGRWAGLEEEHPDTRVLGEPRGEYAARAAAANDHVIEHVTCLPCIPACGDTLSGRNSRARRETGAGNRGGNRGPAGPGEPPDPGVFRGDYTV